MPAMTVYSKPDCVQCVATYRALNKFGLEHEVVDISRDAAALDYVRSLGHQQAPVVVAGEEHWSGFRPDLIKALSVKLAQPSPA
ncbi:glutaredoxin-like protein NrdH [Pseudactinotalea terrae]|uniref:glutaredoxin-like protein NrdH n=1 Tax=Pseudactinotalea terrae TaxID=1743262 RepID=UPI0012E24A8F|nr:glutaredoxin-like protein NrdH [Pseudactinotalea terrae]